jgi:RNA exonuclease
MTGPELTRVSVVDMDLEVLYDKFVKPHNEITDYVTRYSGITEATLRHITTRLTDVQTDLRNLISAHTILVGHSLENDLIALKVPLTYTLTHTHLSVCTLALALIQSHSTHTHM